jgi:hypothetical protein
MVGDISISEALGHMNLKWKTKYLLIGKSMQKKVIVMDLLNAMLSAPFTHNSRWTVRITGVQRRECKVK